MTRATDGARRRARRGGADRADGDAAPRGVSRRGRRRRGRRLPRRDGRARPRRPARASSALPRRGKGQALTLAERACAAGPLLLCDADLAGDLRPLVEAGGDVAIAAFARRVGRRPRAREGRRAGADPAARRPAHARAALRPARALAARARAPLFPVAAGLRRRDPDDDRRRSAPASTSGRSSSTSSTARPDATSRGFAHRGRQLVDLVLACRAAGAATIAGCGCRSSARSSGCVVPAVAPVAAIGLADDLWSGPERGFRAHLRAGATTGTLKLVGIPLWALWRTRSPSRRGARRPRCERRQPARHPSRHGRSRRSSLGALAARRPAAEGGSPLAVLLAPYDLREMAMLGDAGSNALGAVLGLESVRRLTGLRRVERDRRARRRHPRRRAPLARFADRVDARARDPRRARTAPVTDAPGDPLRLRHGRGRLGARQGDRRRLARPPAEVARAPRPGAEVRPVPQRRPRAR